MRIHADVENAQRLGLKITPYNYKNGYVIENELFFPLTDFTVKSTEVKGLIPMMNEFRYATDDAYITKYNALKSAQDRYDALERDMTDRLGELYREGYLSKNNYVDGDEDKLYADAVYAVGKISKPEATYNIAYIDPYGANTDMEYYASPATDNVDWPRITTEYAAHLVDPEISLNLWAYIDKSSVCYDNPWKSNIEINTNLSLLNQHEFTDVMAHIAEVASEAKGKISVYDRSKTINQSGQLSASDINGNIDASVTGITNGTETKFTDGKGNDVWASPDGLSAMTMNSGIFRISNAKDYSGNWIWREFGFGGGFNASEITYGEMSGARIADGTISSAKISANYVSEITPSVISSFFTDFLGAGFKVEDNKIVQLGTATIESGSYSKSFYLGSPESGFSLSRLYVFPSYDVLSSRMLNIPVELKMPIIKWSGSYLNIGYDNVVEHDTDFMYLAVWTK